MRYADAILEIIRTADSHMSAEQIFLALKQTYPSVVLATVYNNLSSLHQQGLIRKISWEGCPDRYDRTARHDHLVCRRCGDLADLALPDLTDQLVRQVGQPIEGYDLKVAYLCPRCQEEQRPSRPSF